MSEGKQVKSFSAELQGSVSDLRGFSTALVVLGEMAPERTTLPQVAFFLLAALADMTGRAATFTEIRETVGPAIGRSLHTTYQVFLDRERHRSDTAKVTAGMGWLEREADPKDNRKKYLKLTAKGREVVRELAAALQHKGA